STAGANGNRFGMYSYTTGAEAWDARQKTFANGTSPTQWQVTINFGSLQGTTTPVLSGPLSNIPTNRIRKMRWTYAADLQAGAYQRSEFQVVVSNWTATGMNRVYSVAGPGSVRIEDHALSFGPQWTESRGNFSSGTIHSATAQGASITHAYFAPQAHTLYVGLRYLSNGAQASISVDGQAAVTVNLAISGEDVLFRFPMGQFAAGSHTMTVTHGGPDGNALYFDFIELAVPTTALPNFPAQPRLTVATDWDTEHSLALAPERTAWMIQSLGFAGRQNHFMGALWFYELTNLENVYASGTVTFSGTPQPNFFVTVTLGTIGQPASTDTVIQKLIHVGDTAETIATVFALELNRGYTAVWASASGNAVTIFSRSPGSGGNNIGLAASTTSGGFAATASGATLTGGADGAWRTDLTVLRLNRAARDWNLSFFTALKGYGIDVAAAFSMELGEGDPSAAAGIAQVGPAGDPIILPTPSLQTNFSSNSLAFWQEVYAEVAALQGAAGLQPFLQFGEVQWWYFPNDGLGKNFSGMPFYDAQNQSQFQAQFGHAMAAIISNNVNPADFPDEASFLPAVIGNFTNAVMNFVKSSQPNCRFEVLYPVDTNQTAFNEAINFPSGAWTASALTVLKTENFGFTLGRNLDDVEAAINLGESKGFPASQRAHLVGVGDSTTPWIKEAQRALGRGFESVVLFALDQFCLIGYAVPLPEGLRRSVRMG
ncbi:MAG: non-contractile tail sheath protein, partial [Bryobacteraceae bacterium]